MNRTLPAAAVVGTPHDPIPLIDLRASYERHRAELDEAAANVIGEQSFIGGAEHDAFAREFAAWCGGGHTALVGNGTDALTFAIVDPPRWHRFGSKRDEATAGVR